MVVIVTVLRNQEPVGLCGGWIPSSPGTEKPWPWSCLHDGCWARVRLLPFSLSTCTFQADFASPECVCRTSILLMKSGSRSLVWFPRLSDLAALSLLFSPHEFHSRGCAASWATHLCARRPLCRQEGLPGQLPFETIPNGLVHGDPCLPFLCLSLFWPCWEFTPAS